MQPSAPRNTTAATAARTALDPTAKLSVALPARDGRWRITLRGIPDYTYRLQCTDSLAEPNWQTVAHARANELGMFDYTDPRQLATRFYRAVHP